MVIFALALLLLIYIIQPWFVITIKLKNGGWEVGVQKASIISLESSPKIITHEVQPGETLSGVASKYEVRQSDLQTWNGIVNPDQIFVGQRLQIRR